MDFSRTMIRFSVVSVLILDIGLFVFGAGSPYVMSLILLSLVPIALLAYYAIQRERYSDTQLDYERAHEPNRRLLRVLSLGALMALTSAIMLFATRNDVYSRPISFFLLTAAAAGLMFAQIVTSHERRAIHVFILGQIVLLAITLRLVPLSMIEGFYGDDPMFHEAFTNSILATWRVPDASSYTDFPLMHVLIASTIDVTGIDFKSATVLAIVIMQTTIWPIFLYIVATAVTGNTKIGLISALLLSFADRAIGFGVLGAFPTTYALLLVMTILAVLFRPSLRKSASGVALLATLFIAVIVAHSLTALLLAVVLTTFLIGESAIRKLTGGTAAPNLRTRLVLTFIVAMLGYWIYVSYPVFRRFIEVITIREGVFASFVTTEGKYYATTIPIWQYSLGLFGTIVLFGLAYVGLVHSVSVIRRSGGLLLTSVAPILIFLTGGFGMVAGLGIAPDRLQYYSYVLISIPTAVGLSVTFRPAKNHLRSLSATLLVAVICFFMITNPFAQVDTPIYSDNLASPRFLRDSEREGVQMLVAVADSRIGCDNDVYSYLRCLEYYNVTIMDFSKAEFDASNLVVVRSFYADSPVYSRGLYMLSYDVESTLDVELYSCIQDTGALRTFADCAPVS